MSFIMKVSCSPSPTAVPEATTWAMMLAGFLGLSFAGYRAKAREIVG